MPNKRIERVIVVFQYVLHTHGLLARFMVEQFSGRR